jgi:hypothetical protein
MNFNTPAPEGIVRWYRKGVPGGGQKDRIFDRLKAKLTGGTDDSGTSYFSMLEKKLSDKDADIIIKNMKTDIDGYPMLETGSTSGQDERTYQEWIVERYLKTAGTEGFTDTSVAEEKKEEEVEEEAEEIVEKAEEEVKENIEEAVEVVDEAIEEADVSEETGDISDITDILPQSFIDAVNQKQGTDYQKTKKSTGVSNTKILSTLVGSLQKIQGQLGSIDNELKKQNALIGAALGTTVSNLNQIETSHDGLNDRFDGILEAFEAQTALKKKELDDAETDAAIDEQDDVDDVAGTEGIKGFDPRKAGSPGYIVGWLKKALGKLWKKFAPKKVRAIVRLFRNKLAKFAPKKLIQSVTKKALGISADAGRRGAQRVVTRSALQIGGKKLAQAGAVKATQSFVKKAALGLMRPIIKRIPIFGGLIDFAVSLMLGEPVGRAAAKAVGATLGGVLGTFIPIPFVGTVIGGVLGDMVGGFLYDALTGGGGSTPKKQETPQQKETGGLTKPGPAVLHGTEAIIPADRYESGTKNQDMTGNALSPIGGALIGASANFLTQAGPAASLVAPMFKQSANALTKFFDVPTTLAQTNVGGSFAGVDTAVKDAKKKSDDEENINPDEFGPEGGTAEEKMLDKMKSGVTGFFGGMLNLFGIRMPPEVDVNDDDGNGGKFGGNGKFIQGNSGASGGIHYHIGPGSYQDGNITSSAGNADARAVAEKVVKHFQGKKSIYIGRLGYTVKESDTPAIIKEKVKRGQEVHSSGGSQGGIDLQVGGAYMPGAKVPFPLKTEGLKYRTGGFGVTAKVSGSNAFVAHGMYDENGKQAPQERSQLYGEGGDTPSVPTEIIVGDRGKEKVMKNLVASFKPVSDMLDAFNAAQSTDEVIAATRAYAPEILMYDDEEGGMGQSIIVVNNTPPIVPIPMGGGGTIVTRKPTTSASKTLLMQKLFA